MAAGHTRPHDRRCDRVAAQRTASPACPSRRCSRQAGPREARSTTTSLAARSSSSREAAQRDAEFVRDVLRLPRRRNARRGRTDAFLKTVRPVVQRSTTGSSCAVAAVALAADDDEELRATAAAGFASWTSALAGRLVTAGMAKQAGRGPGHHVARPARGSTRPVPGSAVDGAIRPAGPHRAAPRHPVASGRCSHSWSASTCPTPRRRAAFDAAGRRHRTADPRAGARHPHLRHRTPSRASRWPGSSTRSTRRRGARRARAAAAHAWSSSTAVRAIVTSIRVEQLRAASDDAPV